MLGVISNILFYSLFIIPLFILGVLYLFYRWQDENRKLLLLKGLAFFFIGIYFFRLFSNDYIESFSNASTLFPNYFVRLLFLLWRAITQGAVVVTLLSPFFKNRYYRTILSLIVPFVALINLILLKVNVMAFIGTFNIRDFRSMEFLWECAVMLTIGCGSLILDLKRNQKFPRKLVLKSVGIYGLVMLTVIPLFTFKGIFGPIGENATGFILVHRIMIYIGFIAPLALYFGFRKKSDEARYLLTETLAVAGVMTYFYTYTFANFTTVTVLPFHLCNTALLLMLIAFTFKSKTFFYFNYFINVLGALIAILMPNTNGDLFDIGNMHFWYNHYYAFFLPLLGIALRVFPRPNFKMIVKAIIVFTAYFIIVAFINSWFNNYGNVDYFFLNSDFIAKKIRFMLNLRKTTVVLHYKDLTFVLYPYYWIAIYFGFIVLTFLMWYVYDAIFRTSDQLQDLFIKKKERMQLLANIEKFTLTKEEVAKVHNVPSSIKISHFTKIYGKNGKKAVDDFSIEVHEGEIFGFLGHNGAGKSTVIKSLVGIQAITEGSIEVCGYDLAKQPLQAKLMIGYVPDNHAVYERLTGREYVNYIADLFLVPEEERKARLAKYVSMFNLEEAIDHQIKTYSHGMKQKITVIAALIHNPKVWVLDEPLTGLDPTSSYQIKECMKDHAKAGNIVFFSSHVIEVVENICDRIAVINKGKLVCVESVHDLKARGIPLENIYLKYVENLDVNVGDQDVA